MYYDKGWAHVNFVTGLVHACIEFGLLFQFESSLKIYGDLHVKDVGWLVESIIFSSSDWLLATE